MDKINTIAEQTEYLIEKQKEVLHSFQENFKGLNALLKESQEKAEQAKSGPELESFQNVFSILSEQEEIFAAQFEEDITFLNEQLGAIKEIQNISDPERKKELTEELLEKDYEPVETARFKADVEQEAEEAKVGFEKMVADLKASYEEEGIAGLEAFLVAQAEACRAECEEDCEEDCKDSECCGGTEPDCKSQCSGCSGSNIFEGLEIEEKEEKS